MNVPAGPGVRNPPGRSRPARRAHPPVANGREAGPTGGAGLVRSGGARPSARPRARRADQAVTVGWCEASITAPGTFTIVSMIPYSFASSADM